MTLGRGQKSLTCQFQRFLFQTLCVFSQIKDRKHIEQNFHSVARVMLLCGTWGIKNFSLGIYDGAPSTVRSSFRLYYAKHTTYAQVFKYHSDMGHRFSFS